ncbi:hypothetical protein HY065_02545, partial [Candidatus Berkelbacteria bacterium]|nr:hypothetical protein [Candidatus Berkelbacteria bacterium]
MSKSQELLATEHPTVDAAPGAVRAAAATAEPQAIVDMYDVEDLGVAIGVSDRLHGHQNPFAFRLIFILQPELHTNLGRAQRKAKLKSFGVDLLPGGAIRKAEIGDSDQNQINLGRIRGDRYFVKNVAAPRPYLTPCFRQCLTQGLYRLLCTDPDGFPSWPLGNGQRLGTLFG